MSMPREMFPVASMLVSLWHAIPQLIILVLACLATGFWGDGPLWVPDAVGMGAAFLGFVLIMVYGTAFGLMFSCVNVIFRDFQRIVQTFINMIPFTTPMMYPYWITFDRLPRRLARDLPRQPGGRGRPADPARLLVPHVRRPAAR